MVSYGQLMEIDVDLMEHQPTMVGQQSSRS